VQHPANDTRQPPAVTRLLQQTHGTLQQSHGCYNKSDNHRTADTTSERQVAEETHQQEEVTADYKRRHGWQVAKKTLQRRPHQISEQQQE